MGKLWRKNVRSKNCAEVYRNISEGKGFVGKP
jgi:hypothetical protein